MLSLKTLFQKEARLRRNLPLLAWNEFFAELRLFYPVAVLVFESVTGSFATAMAVFSILNISQALFEIPTGVWSDKMGRRKTFIIGSLSEMAGGLFYYIAFFTNYGMWSFFMGATCFGFANALYSGNNNALVYETLDYYRAKKEMSEVFGKMRTMGQVALTLSGILATLCLWRGLSYESLVFFSLFPLALSTLFSFFLVEPPRQKGVQEHNSLQHLKDAVILLWKHPTLFRIACAGALKRGLGDSSHSMVPGFVETVWPIWMTPLFRALQNVFGAIGFFFAGRINKKIGLMNSVLYGTVYSTVMYMIGYFANAFYSPMLFLTTQISYAFSATADEALQQERFSDQQRATMGSVISVSTAIVGALGSVLLGVMADLWGARTALIMLMVMGTPSAYIYFSASRIEKSNP